MHHLWSLFLRMAVPHMNYLLTTYENRELRKAQRRRVRDIADPFDICDDEFVSLWRVNKDMAHYIVQKLDVDLAPRGEGLPTHMKVLVSISLLANGGYTRQLGQDHTICHAQSTASKYIGLFVEAAYRRLYAEWVQFPITESARSDVAQKFQEKYGVPGVLGLIDCTHVKIFPPPRPQGAQYKNVRKSAHTINVQLVSDSERRILNVNARYPGRVHDSFIWHQCNVKQEMKNLHDRQISQYFLLGDSGYPLEPWLMTPILHAEPNSPEERYTDWHCRVRNAIERTNGYLKGSLRCLGIDRVLHYAPAKASQIIYVACIIYNLMKHFGVPLEEEHQEDDEDEPINEVQSARLLRIARAKRAQIIEHYFT